MEKNGRSKNMNKDIKSGAQEERASEVQWSGTSLVLPAPTWVILNKSLQILSLSFFISNNQELA